MDYLSLQSTLLQWLLANGYASLARENDHPQEADLVVGQHGISWSLYLVDGRPGEGSAATRSFDSAVGRVVRDARSAPAGRQFALCLRLPPAGERLQLHLVRALKKYSNSIVFEDLQLGLWLVFNPGYVEIIAPAAANAFLRDPLAAIKSFYRRSQEKKG